MTSGTFPRAKKTLKIINKIDTKEVIDQGIVIWFPGPQSYGRGYGDCMFMEAEQLLKLSCIN